MVIETQLGSVRRTMDEECGYVPLQQGVTAFVNTRGQACTVTILEGMSGRPLQILRLQDRQPAYIDGLLINAGSLPKLID